MFNNIFFRRLIGRTKVLVIIKAINKIVKKRIKLIGLDESLYGAHSLRAGFITQSVSSGKTIYETIKFTGHRDIETAQSYIRL